MGKSLNAATLAGLVLPVFLAGASFASVSEPDWASDGWRLLVGALALSLATLHTLRLQGGSRAAGRFLASTLAIAWLAEAVGLRGGWLFGGVYAYHPALRPVLPGGVPLFIPFAWFVLAGIPVVLLRSLDTTRPDGRAAGGRRLFKAAFAAVGVVALDLALDPIAVSTGLWTWASPGAYFGVPWTNFAGWWGVAFAVFLVGDGWAGLGRAGENRRALRYDLTWTLAHLLLLVLLGGAAIRRVGSAWPAAWTIVALAPLIAVWLRDLGWSILAARACALTSKSVSGVRLTGPADAG